MNLLLRIVSVVVLLPLVIYLSIWGAFPFFALIGIVFALSMYEYVVMATGLRGPVQFFFCAIASLLFLSLTLLKVGAAFVLLAAICFAIGIYFIAKPELSREHFEKAALWLFGLAYIGSGLVSLYMVRSGASPLSQSEMGLSFLFLTLLVTWSNDTFAYFAGRLFGKHKLHPRVSENKTWEGFLGGAVGCVAMPFVLQALLSVVHVSPWALLTTADLLFVAVPTIALAPLGDLFESRIKRLCGVKDSGNILPGHGGLLDRIDALLIVGPWVLAYAFLIRPLW